MYVNTQTLDKALEINNNAIENFTITGNFQHALGQFSRSIKLFKEEAQDVNASMDHTLTGFEQLTELSLDDVVSHQLPSLDQVPCSLAFGQFISFPTRQFQGQRHSPKHIETYSAAIIYNLAVLHHYMALQTVASFDGDSMSVLASCGPQLLLGKAEKLYNAVSRMFDRGSPNGCPFLINSEVAMLLYMANDANLASLRGVPSFAAGQNSEYMLRLLSQRVHKNSSHQSKRPIQQQRLREPEQVYDLLWSTFLLGTPPRSAPAA